MRVAFDLLGAPSASGGMSVYAGEVVSSWREAFPEDEVLVIGYGWSQRLIREGVQVRVVPSSMPVRVLGQWILSGVLARRWGADVLISASQVVSPLMPRRRRFCVVHDWRHLVRPAEFSRLQRWYRRSWRWSMRHASIAFQISEKTGRETARLAPGATTVVTPNGEDHARRWDVGPTGRRRDVVTFGHLPNKRADLVLRAFSRLPAAGAPPTLVVLGATGDQAHRLRDLAEQVGVTTLELPGFVADDRYADLVANASAVVLASTDEGFGLPVSEARYFGVPCVVTSDSGLDELHPGRVLVADPTPDALATVLADALRRAPSEQARAVGTWRDHVVGMRHAVTSSLA